MIGSRSTLQAKLFRAFTLVTIIAAALPAVFSRNMLQQERLDLAGRQALAQATLLRGLLEAGIDGPAQAALLASVKEAGLRMTVTGEGGVVALDSHVGEKDLPELDNHNDRPEIESARMTGQGVSLRHSNTLGIDAMYAAVALADNRVLRLAVPLAGINRSLEKELSSMSLAVAGVAAFCLAL